MSYNFLEVDQDFQIIGSVIMQICQSQPMKNNNEIFSHFRTILFLISDNFHCLMHILIKRSQKNIGVHDCETI